MLFTLQRIGAFDRVLPEHFEGASECANFRLLFRANDDDRGITARELRHVHREVPERASDRAADCLGDRDRQAGQHQQHGAQHSGSRPEQRIDIVEIKPDANEALQFRNVLHQADLGDLRAIGAGARRNKT